MDDRQILQRLKLFLFDLDGTLYLSDTPFPFTGELLEVIRSQGHRYLFMTNNSSKSVADYMAEMNRQGIPAAYEDFITASQATAYYLKNHYPDATLYVCGSQSLQQELQKQGFSITDDPEKTACIVIGFDTELTYQKIKDISYLLCTKDLPYIATNPDYVCPTAFGCVPDCGALCEMLFSACHKRPVVIGKPKPLMPRLAMERWHCTPEETAVIGDRLYTDIRCGNEVGAVSILVMTGETTPELLAASADKPDVVLPSCQELLDILKS